jgi:hypothetical protein
MLEHEHSEYHGDLALSFSGFHQANRFIVVDLSCAAISEVITGYLVQIAFHAEKTCIENLSKVRQFNRRSRVLKVRRQIK